MSAIDWHKALSLAEASKTIDDAEVRTRAMTRQLRTVEQLPEHRVQQLLPGLLADEPDDAETGTPG